MLRSLVGSEMCIRDRLYREQTLALKKISLAPRQAEQRSFPTLINKPKRLKSASPVGLSTTIYSVHHEIRGKYTRPPVFSPHKIPGSLPSAERIKFSRNISSRERSARVVLKRPLELKTGTLKPSELQLDKEVHFDHELKEEEKEDIEEEVKEEEKEVEEEEGIEEESDVGSLCLQLPELRTDVILKNLKN